MPSVGIATGAGRGMGLACAERLAQTVDHLLLVDLDEASLTTAAASTAGHRAKVEPFVLDVTDGVGLASLAARVTELGELRAVAHAAGISPTMADWRRIFTVDLVGTAMLAEVLRPLAGPGSAMVCFSSMSALLGTTPTSEIEAVLGAPLEADFLQRVRDVLGDVVEDTGVAYAWAKRGVQLLVRCEAIRLGAVGARICSISPGIIDTPQGRQEADAHDIMQVIVDKTPLKREGRAEELAAVTAFLLSDEASFVNGTDILVDGGACAALLTPS